MVRPFRARRVGLGALSHPLVLTALLALLVPSAAADTVGTPIGVPVAELHGVACPTATICEAVGFSGGGVLVPITKGKPGHPRGVPGAFELWGVECQSTASCLTVGDDPESPVKGVVASISGGKPTASIAVPGTSRLSGVACETGKRCEAVGYRATSGGVVGVVVPISGGVPQTPIKVPGTDALNAVACESTTSCLAVGDNGAGVGQVVPITGGSPGDPIRVPHAASLTGVACPSMTRCVAVGDNSHNFGLVVPITGGVPGEVLRIPGYAQPDGVSCQGSTCEAVGAGGLNGQKGMVVPIRERKPRRSIGVRGTYYLAAVACQSNASCEAVGGTRFHGVVLSTSLRTGSAYPSGGWQPIPTMWLMKAARSRSGANGSPPSRSRTDTRSRS